MNRLNEYISDGKTMNFWKSHIDRNPFLALAWIRLSSYEKLGEMYD